MAENCSEPGKDFPAQRGHEEKSRPVGAFRMRDPSIQSFYSQYNFSVFQNVRDRKELNNPCFPIKQQ